MAGVTHNRSTAVIQAALLLSIVALTVPSASALTFYVPREKTPNPAPANMELEKGLRELLSKMSEEEKDNISSYCAMSSEKVPIPSNQENLIIMCRVLGYKPLILQVKPKRSLSDYVRRSHWLRPTRHF